MAELPVIDIAPLLEAADRATPASAARAVSREIDAACRETGFFYVTGHGVDRALRARLRSLSQRFFSLPEDDKQEIAMARAGLAWRGWFPVGGELTSGVPDMKEGVYFGAELADDDPRVAAGTPLHGHNLFPRQVPQLRRTVLDYLAALTEVGQVLLRGIAMALELPPGWFGEHLTADPVVLFRIFRYPPEPAPAGWGVGEHTDYGLLTLLDQDDVGGLQVRTPAGWVDAEPREGMFVCNIGDMLDRLTGGRYRSTPHRVYSPTGAERLSFPFFLDPSWDAVVDRLPIVERPAEDEAARRWDHMNVHGFTGTYGEYLLAKVSKVFPKLAPPA